MSLLSSGLRCLNKSGLSLSLQSRVLIPSAPASASGPASLSPSNLFPLVSRLSSVLSFRSSLLSNQKKFFYYTQNPYSHNQAPQMHATTILTVRKGGNVVVIGDGQVSLGPSIVKSNARKVRVIGNGKVICGFAGSTADCFALLDRLEKKLEEYPGQLLRASVEMAKEWRSDKYLRQLEAWMIAVDKEISVTITGNGDVMSAPDDGVVAIGSGGLYAVSAARALVGVQDLKLTPKEIAERAMNIASDICVYTNKNFIVEEMVDGVIQSSLNKAEKK